jgi:hypothetical protein
MNNPETVIATPTKEEYATPQLIVYGNVADLTRGGVSVSTADLQSQPTAPSR